MSHFAPTYLVARVLFARPMAIAEPPCYDTGRAGPRLHGVYMWYKYRHTEQDMLDQYRKGKLNHLDIAKMMIDKDNKEILSLKKDLAKRLAGRFISLNKEPIPRIVDKYEWDGVWIAIHLTDKTEIKFIAIEYNEYGEYTTHDGRVFDTIERARPQAEFLLKDLLSL